MILTEIQIRNIGLQFQILESRLNKLRAFDLITRIGSIETERTIATKLIHFEITNTKIRSCQFRCFTNNTVNVRRFTFLSMDLSDNNLGSSKLLETKVICRLNSEDFSNFFLFRYYFLNHSLERTYLIVPKNVKIFSNIDGYSWFFRPFRGFSFKICTVSYSHVICTIRFAIKYHVVLSLLGRWGRLGKIGFILIKNGIFGGHLRN